MSKSVGGPEPMVITRRAAASLAAQTQEQVAKTHRVKPAAMGVLLKGSEDERRAFAVDLTGAPVGGHAPARAPTGRRLGDDPSGLDARIPAFRPVRAT